MNLYIEQKLFSWSDRFSIYDAAGNVAYTAEGEIFTFGKKLHIYDFAGREVAYIEQKVFSFLPKYYIHRPGWAQTAEVVKEFPFFHQEYSVYPMGWTVRGDFSTTNTKSGQAVCLRLPSRRIGFAGATRTRSTSARALTP